MKRTLLLILLPIFCVLLQAQETIVVDGVTFSADKKKLIQYPEEKTDIEYVVPEGTEVIGSRAFPIDWLSPLKKVTLPMSLKAIEDFAFYDSQLSTIVWGNYPEKVGIGILNESKVSNFEVQSDESNCVVIDRLLYSTDKKKVLRAPVGIDNPFYDITILEGVETIGKGAFEFSLIYSSVVLPASLNTIEDYAFWERPNPPTKAMSQTVEYHNEWSFYEFSMKYTSVVCNALVPPKLIGNPFAWKPIDAPSWEYKYFKKGELKVPEKSVEIYSNDSQWTYFERINGVRNVSNAKVSEKLTNVWLDDSALHVTSEKIFKKITIYTPSGLTLKEQNFVNGVNSCDFDLSKIDINELLIIKVLYTNESEELIKIMK